MNRGMNHPFVIAEVAATRGKGVRATRSLQRGQIVLREEPLFEIDPAMYACPIVSWANMRCRILRVLSRSEEVLVDRLKELFAQLEPEVRERALELGWSTVDCSQQCIKPDDPLYCQEVGVWQTSTKCMHARSPAHRVYIMAFTAACKTPSRPLVASMAFSL